MVAWINNKLVLSKSVISQKMNCLCYSSNWGSGFHVFTPFLLNNCVNERIEVFLSKLKNVLTRPINWVPLMNRKEAREDKPL